MVAISCVLCTPRNILWAPCHPKDRKKTLVHFLGGWFRWDLEGFSVRNAWFLTFQGNLPGMGSELQHRRSKLSSASFRLRVCLRSFPNTSNAMVSNDNPESFLERFQGCQNFSFQHVSSHCDEVHHGMIIFSVWMLCRTQSLEGSSCWGN